MKTLLEPGVYVVAVSGGVDSVVLLDMLVRQKGLQLIVAHFDHGVREDSASDAEFVRGLARGYKLPYVAKREELGRGVSEERARTRRYAFLREVAAKHQARIVTAHHADDVVETIAINLRRGTGWRGLAVLDSPDIARPLLAYRKREILAFAKEHSLEWREDSTNQEQVYLRNQLRLRITEMLDDDSILQILALHSAQRELKREIDQETEMLLGSPPYSRYFFGALTDRTAVELLRALCLRATGSAPTLPQRQRALMAIKVAQPGSLCDVSAHIKLLFTKRDFTVVDT